ncbi:MAG: hypothetical protein K0B02_01735 [DPANN group archaeon]|nr:hypothetical protein [DPANN group archaeon]
MENYDSVSNDKENISKATLVSELEFCINLWKQQSYCEFAGHTDCDKCATPYLLNKLITGELLHGPDVKRLDVNEWYVKLEEIKGKYC